MKLHSCRPRSKGFGCLDLQQARFRTFSHVCRVRFGQGVDQVRYCYQEDGQSMVSPLGTLYAQNRSLRVAGVELAVP